LRAAVVRRLPAAALEVADVAEPAGERAEQLSRPAALAWRATDGEVAEGDAQAAGGDAHLMHRLHLPAEDARLMGDDGLM
jgi:hypothetical protein